MIGGVHARDRLSNSNSNSNCDWYRDRNYNGHRTAPTAHTTFRDLDLVRDPLLLRSEDKVTSVLEISISH